MHAAQSAQLSLDGITDEINNCTCAHCQMDHMIDGIVAPAHSHKEDQDDSTHIDVYQQVDQ